VEVHDDDPDHFESAPKFIYKLDYNSQAVEIVTGEDEG
jgi:hypothetical protein